MKTKRERKHPRIEVSGDIHLAPQIPRWEAELLAAVLSRLATSQAPISEVTHAAG